MFMVAQCNCNDSVSFLQTQNFSLSQCRTPLSHVLCKRNLTPGISCCKTDSWFALLPMIQSLQKVNTVGHEVYFVQQLSTYHSETSLSLPMDSILNLRLSCLKCIQLQCPCNMSDSIRMWQCTNCEISWAPQASKNWNSLLSVHYFKF